MVNDTKSILAILGGEKSVTKPQNDIYKWPIITQEDEDAVLEVLRRGGMSGTDVTMKFEKEYAEWMGCKYALGYNNGTASLLGAMWACKVGVGDEVICPSVTYWASAAPALSLGASVVFAEVDPMTLCIDPKDIEHRITDRTKAIVVVHYCGYPCDMDEIMAIAKKHNVKVIEDVSHAHGSLYKGTLVGTIGDVGGASLMASKSFAIGEAGMLTTNDLEIYERAAAFGHYERYNDSIQTENLREFMFLPLGGCKNRMHQLSSACGRVQLKYYPERIAEIQKSINYFWDLLEGLPGIRAHRPAKDSGSTMGGWYYPHGIYVPEELDGLSVTRFVRAVKEEGTNISTGCNANLHTHPLFHTADVYGHGKPTNIANANRDLRQPKGSLPISEKISERCFGIPWFKKFYPEVIEEHANSIKKVITNYRELLADDPGNPENMGRYSNVVKRKED